MSRTSQKKFSAYQDGLDDGLCGRPVRWLQHPKLEHYMAGYKEGQKARLPVKPRDLKFWERVYYVIFGF